jgi:hypothetical protein
MRNRVFVFVGIFVVLAIAGGVYLVSARDRAEERIRSAPEVAVVAKKDLPSYLDGSRLIFSSAGPEDFGQVAVAKADDPGGPRAMVDLDCDRVDVAQSGGFCVQTQRDLLGGVDGIILDGNLEEKFRVPLAGVPSRARVSADGKYAAATLFVNGDSYAPGAFSTRTSIFRMKDGKLLGDMEDWKVTKNGKVVNAVDENFWGVTFAPDSDTFYATLGTGGETYLIKGSISSKKAKVIYDGVECPSVSPDGTKIAYKKSTSGSLDTPTWRLHVLDLATMKNHALNETHTVDDQVEWLDDGHVAYARLTSPDEVQQTNVWEVPVEGKGKPRRLVLLAGSPSVS